MHTESVSKYALYTYMNGSREVFVFYAGSKIPGPTHFALATSMVLFDCNIDAAEGQKLKNQLPCSITGKGNIKGRGCSAVVETVLQGALTGHCLGYFLCGEAQPKSQLIFDNAVIGKLFIR